MTACGAEIVAAARSYLGTPFAHQGRAPGAGLDCAGLVVCAYRAAGIEIIDRRGYSRLPRPPEMRLALEDNARRLEPGEELQPADVLWLRFEQPQHLALWTGETIIHAYLAIGRVVEHGTDLPWLARGRLVAAYRHPEVVQ